MKWFYELITNRILISAAAGWFIAQLSKMIVEICKGTFSVQRLTGSGGMPSTHSATVCALATACGIVEGPHSGVFIVAVFMAFIVMYDAMGVRYATGRNGRMLNELNRRLKAEGKEPISEEVLPEKMGHTLPEIIVGAVLGIFIACLVCLVFMKG